MASSSFIRLLHINSYYFTNKIHYNFRNELEKKNVVNEYFVPLYKNAKNVFEDAGVNKFYIYKRYDKIFFFTKIIKAYFTLKKNNKLDQISLIHAHTLISDGLIAYLVYLIDKKKYVVTIRNTDINYFLPNFLFRFIGKIIIKNSNQVFCISPTYRDKVLSVFPDIPNTKFEVLPNGIDPYWSKNQKKESKKIDKNVINILFVGRLDQNKNLQLLLKFMKTYNDRVYILTIAGENVLNYDFAKIERSLPGSNRVVFLGHIDKIQNLLNVYRNNDVFVLLSYRETFGVSYIESLSQGLPIIYTENEGIDGFFRDGEVGYRSNPQNLGQLKANIDMIVENYPKLSQNAVTAIDKFQWSVIIQRYCTIVEKITK